MAARKRTLLLFLSIFISFGYFFGESLESSTGQYSLDSFRQRMKNERKRFLDEIEEITTSSVESKIDSSNSLKTGPDSQEEVFSSRDGANWQVDQSKEEEHQPDPNISESQSDVKKVEELAASPVQKEGIQAQPQIQPPTLGNNTSMVPPKETQLHTKKVEGFIASPIQKGSVQAQPKIQPPTAQIQPPTIESNIPVVPPKNVDRNEIDQAREVQNSATGFTEQSKDGTEINMASESGNENLSDLQEIASIANEGVVSQSSTAQNDILHGSDDENDEDELQVEVQIHVNPSPDFMIDGNTFDIKFDPAQDGRHREGGVAEELNEEEDDDDMSSEEDILELYESVAQKQALKSQKRAEKISKKETNKRLKVIKNQLMTRPFTSFEDFENEKKRKGLPSKLTKVGSNYFIFTSISIAAWTYTTVNQLRRWVSATAIQQSVLAIFTGSVALSLCSCRSLLLDLPSTAQEGWAPPSQGARTRAGFLVGLSACGLLGTLVSLFALAREAPVISPPGEDAAVPYSLRVMVPLASVLPLALSYDQPIIPYKGRRVAWRCLPVARLAMGVLQAALAVGCPVFLGWRSDLSSQETALGITQCICFGIGVAASVNACLVLSDIQSVREDRAQGKLTVPVVFGSSAAKSLALFLTVQAMGLFFTAEASPSLWALNSMLTIFMIFGFKHINAELRTVLLKTQGLMACIFLKLGSYGSVEKWWQYIQNVYCSIFQVVEKGKKRIQKSSGWGFKLHFS